MSPFKFFMIYSEKWLSQPMLCKLYCYTVPLHLQTTPVQQIRFQSLTHWFSLDINVRPIECAHAKCLLNPPVSCRWTWFYVNHIKIKFIPPFGAASVFQRNTESAQMWPTLILDVAMFFFMHVENKKKSCKSVITLTKPQSIVPVCHDKNQAQSRLNTSHQTIDSMLNETSPFQHEYIKTAQACKTYWEGTEKAEV